MSRIRSSRSRALPSYVSPVRRAFRQSRNITIALIDVPSPSVGACCVRIGDASPQSEPAPSNEHPIRLGYFAAAAIAALGDLWAGGMERRVDPHGTARIQDCGRVWNSCSVSSIDSLPARMSRMTPRAAVFPGTFRRRKIWLRGRNAGLHHLAS